METNGCVMVVEDDDGLREAMGSVLEDAGFAVTGFDGAVAALAQLRLGGVGLVFLDLGLWDVSGQAFMHACHDEPALRAVPVVLVSGQEGVARLARQLGAVGSIRKPFDSARLIELARRWMCCPA